MVADNWTKSAMRDGGVVAELLLKLKEADVTPANPALRWGIRQPRSRSPRRDGDSAKISRCNPNISLPWSDGSGGGSDYAGKYEATSRQFNGFLTVGSKSTEVGIGAKSRENEKLKRIKVIHEQPHLHQDPETETSFLLPDLNMMPSQNDNLLLNHYFSPHVETLYASIKIS